MQVLGIIGLIKMSRSAKSYACWLAITMCIAVGSARAAQYSYCNVYAESICFSIRRGDVLEHTIPEDFALFDLALSSGAKILVYSGYNAPEGGTLPLMKTATGKYWKVSLYRYEEAGRAKDRFILLSFDDGKQYAFSISNVDAKMSATQVIDFLSNVRACKSEKDFSIRCSETFPVREVSRGLFD